MKTSKRILSVTIRRIYDESPDTSTLGEYSNRPDTEFAIDRASGEFQGDIDGGQDWLERIKARLEDEYNELNDSFSAEDQPAKHWLFQLQGAINEIDNILADEPFYVEWDRRQYRYFNGCVENYKGELVADIREYVKQDFDRMERLNAGDWHYIGIKAEAEIGIGDFANYPKRFDYMIQNITSGSLWGIESDSDQSYLESVEKEELGDLRSQLHALGFSKRAISLAFKTVERKDS